MIYDVPLDSAKWHLTSGSLDLAPAPKIGYGLPAALAVAGMLLGAALAQRRRTVTGNGAEAG